jgi:heterotetrameric sarcosine oxidase gamma subunit
MSDLAFRNAPPESIIRIRTFLQLRNLPDLPVALPPSTGACEGNGPVTMCLCPQEWMVVSETGTSAKLDLHPANEIPGVFLFEQTDAFDRIRLEGPAAPWLLAKHTSLEIVPGDSRAGHCARTRFAHISVLIHQYVGSDGHDVFDLYFDRSLTAYVSHLLTEGAPHTEELYRRWGARDPVRS